MPIFNLEDICRLGSVGGLGGIGCGLGLGLIKLGFQLLIFKT